MGRQIRFIHSEVDVRNFLNAVAAFDSRIIIDGKYTMLPEAAQYIADTMQTNKFQFFIVPTESVPLDAEIRKYQIILDGQAVEFSNCRRTDPGSYTYEVGRLYVSTLYSGEEQTRSLELYESMRKIIRKNYFFSKRNYLYVGPDFMKHYNCGQYIATCLGNPIVL